VAFTTYIVNICNFQGAISAFFFGLIFHKAFDTTIV
jgi:hypothetical protein